jgi:RNA polymerase sigma-70 factor (ECF subfamily)
MFDIKNPYTLRCEIIEGITRYYVSFADGEGVHRTTEVSKPVYMEFERFIKVERNLRRWDERHIERSELSDEALYKRALFPPKSIEEATFVDMQSEKLQRVVKDLPETQRRRFVLYYDFGFNYRQIADKEGCTARAVEYSVTIAKLKIRKYFEK